MPSRSKRSLTDLSRSHFIVNAPPGVAAQAQALSVMAESPRAITLTTTWGTPALRSASLRWSVIRGWRRASSAIRAMARSRSVL